MKLNAIICLYCGEEFVSKRSDTQYCCSRHRQQAYLRREQDRYSIKPPRPSESINLPANSKKEFNIFSAEKNLLLLEAQVVILKKENQGLRELITSMLSKLESSSLNY